MTSDYESLLRSVKEAHEALIHGPSQYKWMANPLKFIQLARDCVGLAGTRPGESVYDIGCGAGYVLWVCRERLQCRIAGCEPLRDGPIYKELHDALCLREVVTSHASTIEHPLHPDATQYDVIFATWITWIGFGNWSEAEFARYIRNCMSHLRPHGRILLRFEESRFPEGTYESTLLSLGKKVAPLCYVLRRPGD